MLIIITHHFGVHGVFHVLEPAKNILGVDNLTWQLIFTQLVSWGGSLGNILFMMITGYFMINRSVSVKKILLLIGAMFFYSWLIEGISYGLIGLPYTIKGLITNTVPLWFGHNWFVSCYIVFSIFIPFVNKLLTSLTKRQYLILLLLLFVFYNFIPAFKGATFMKGAPLIFFGFGYALGGYLKLYNNDTTGNLHGRCAKYLIALLATIEISTLLLDGCGVYLHNDKIIQHATHFAGVLSVPLAISLFLYFKTLKPFYNSKINAIAGTVLGVYLIHDNDLMRKIIWDYVYPNLEYVTSDFYILFYIGKVIAVFFVCALIEFYRKKYIEPIFLKFLDNHWNNIQSVFIRKAEWVVSKLM